MTTSAMATQQTSGLSWLKTAGKILYIVMVLAIAFVVYKSSWYAGTTWLLLAGLVYILFFLEADKRKFYLFVLLNLAIIAFVGGFIQGHLMRNARLVRFIQENALLAFLLDGYRETVIWSTIIGLTVALLLTLIPLLIIAYVGAVYVLALHQMDGVNWWDAMRYLITLLLDINLPFIVVENGQALITKKAAKLDVIGGPGHLIIKQGNVVVLERGGKITRIVNAGVTKLKSLETIRNIFPLNGQSNSDRVKGVLTKDRIPLDINISIGFQIEPAAEAEKRIESRIAPDGEALTAKLDDGMYQVYEGTIRKAALMSQAPSFKQRHLEKCEDQFCYDVEETDWKKIAGGVPGSDLRDYIMSHRFDELFELSGGADGAEPELRVNKRKIYEIEQAILKQIKPGKAKGLGILVRNVDIGKIEFPLKIKSTFIESMSSDRRAFGQAEAIRSIGNAKTEAIAALLDRVLTLITNRLPYADEKTIKQLFAVLQNVYQSILRDDVLLKDSLDANLDAMKKLAESEGPKILNTGMLMDTSHLLPSQVKSNDCSMTTTITHE